MNFDASDPNYPKGSLILSATPNTPTADYQTNLETLKAWLPQADPTYLQSQADAFDGDHEGLRWFITNAIETREYPTLKEYIRRQIINAQVNVIFKV